MKYSLFTFLLLLGCFSPGISAAEVITSRPELPYQLLPMMAEEGTYEYLGQLRDNPIMYELSLATTTELNFTLTQPAGSDPSPLALLIVRALPTGRVELVSRVVVGEEGWNLKSDRYLGMAWWTLPTHAETLPAGSYRIEVSSPINQENFRLVVGEDGGWVGYADTWRRIAAINDFYDRPTAMWLDSWFVLGHILLALILYLLVRYMHIWWPFVQVLWGLCSAGWSLLYEYGKKRLSR